MREIYLIRHGRTEANEKKLYCGSTDLALSETGKKELEMLNYQVPSDCIFITSGMKRTEETLRQLFGNVPFKADRRFREVDFGEFEMRGYEQLKDLPAYQNWILGDNESNVPPNGESGAQMKERILEGWADLQKEPASIVLIAHGGVIAALMAEIFPEEGKNRYQWQPKPGRGYVIRDGKYQEIETDENCI